MTTISFRCVRKGGDRSGPNLLSSNPRPTSPPSPFHHHHHHQRSTTHTTACACSSIAEPRSGPSAGIVVDGGCRRMHACMGQKHRSHDKKDETSKQANLLLFVGARKVLNSELWHACAGPLVSLPQPGSLVYYFPQGHSEQVVLFFLIISCIVDTDSCLYIIFPEEHSAAK
ncbi:hypothetical protein B296_00038387 [Ensete ventricosum]|uniref:Auxin response factor domain-containing protein n=1 Tax=Ensete ventricosum TaxID=4639 RepID=A0A426ZWG7_ENSVE|nr:hypothetical protein B296_00038387 [Ensete ventricosum]